MQFLLNYWETYQIVYKADRNILVPYILFSCFLGRIFTQVNKCNSFCHEFSKKKIRKNINSH